MSGSEGALMLAVYVWVVGALVTALVATTLDIIMKRSARFEDVMATVMFSLLAWPVILTFAAYDKYKTGRWPWE